MTFIVFAHRGGSLETDENTSLAVEHTHELCRRYPEIDIRLETDVHLTRDGRVMLSHDPTIDRVFSNPGRICDLNWNTIASMRSTHGGQPVLLADVLDSLPQLALNIDAKEDRVVDPLARVVKKCGAKDRVLCASFSHHRLSRLRRIHGLSTSASRREVALIKVLGSTYTKTVLSGAEQTLCQAVQVPMCYNKLRIVSRRFVTAVHRQGKQIHVWTVNDMTMMRHLLCLGVDGIITDAPMQCIEAYKSHQRQKE